MTFAEGVKEDDDGSAGGVIRTGQPPLRDIPWRGFFTPEGNITAPIGCAVEGAILQRVRIPPSNCRSSR